MESEGRKKGWHQPQRAVGLSNNPDPALCSSLSTVWLGLVQQFWFPGSSSGVPVACFVGLWN